MKIAPSILSADFANLEKEVKRIEKAGADYVHIDAMDGVFVNNLTLGPNIVQAIRPHTKLPLDCHLMIQNPENLIPAFAKAGADIISIHVEATNHIHGAIQLIKNEKIAAGVVINPGTPLAMIKPILGDVDMVLVMTVNPGFGGQTFIESTLSKIKELKELRETNNYTYKIEVDGGISDQTISRALEAGADIFVAGSYIFGATDMDQAFKALRDAEHV
ncbi:Ribulose-phosphate 3-epimerase [Jeotgalibaca dankookensis]|uniref:Ribulose-phosphate 3-epimerase n=1 Tax=Jeotgalibaca dankookensis TaxID=708126 RepID=A0A1S6IN12_9LACT|nr:ribulose-phosphate 3-epimerase [Jeotgalibaca dankookensis]AQS52944.1 Ribulose-phosphate 3-epimerase [Jeotgalibaca dankookensis]